MLYINIEELRRFDLRNRIKISNKSKLTNFFAHNGKINMFYFTIGDFRPKIFTIDHKTTDKIAENLLKEYKEIGLMYNEFDINEIKSENIELLLNEILK